VITYELDGLHIPYSIDASSSLFVHGIEDFETDDLDIMIQWDHFETAHHLLQNELIDQFLLTK